VGKDLGGEVSLNAFQGSNLAKGEKFDVGMPADLDQFWGNDSHRTVIGGEGLVQLGHDPTNG
jgi:hypothetical protein